MRYVITFLVTLVSVVSAVSQVTRVSTPQHLAIDRKDNLFVGLQYGHHQDHAGRDDYESHKASRNHIREIATSAGSKIDSDNRERPVVLSPPARADLFLTAQQHTSLNASASDLIGKN